MQKGFQEKYPETNCAVGANISNEIGLQHVFAFSSAVKTLAFYN